MRANAVRGLLGALALCASVVSGAEAQPRRQSSPWMPDQGDGTYRNPVLAGDYSDPDVVRVGDDFYLTSSSFVNAPGLPILHSRDLVNWTIIGHALAHVPPYARYETPRRGSGVWAPAIRHHEGRFYIYYPDPDRGIFVVTATDPRGPWSEPVLVDGSRGAIDPAPFWDEDGQAWLLMAWARSRAGINNIITLKRMSPDGMRVLDEGRTIIDGATFAPAQTSNGAIPWVTIEGPKIHRRDGYYYIFAPAGGVKAGWQGVFRSRSIEGPYEARNVLDQGRTEINGPHQGAWVDTPRGEHWFLHFQDADSYGRIVHLQPLRWRSDGWPVIGADPDGDGRGEPVLRHRMPRVGARQPIVAPVTDDEFDAAPNLAWQWNSNPNDYWRDASAPAGVLRLNSASSSVNLYEAGNLLTQKLPGPDFTATTRLTYAPRAVGERAGLLMFGYNYGWIGLERTADGVRIVQVTRNGANTQGAETVTAGPAAPEGAVLLRMAVTREITADTPAENGPVWPSLFRGIHARVVFSYSTDGETFTQLGEPFITRQSRWVGAQMGLFAQAPSGTPSFVATSNGYADFDWFRVTR